ISSCIIIQLLGAFIPVFRNCYINGQEGRKKLVRYTYRLTIILSIIQSFFISRWLENPTHFQGLNMVISPSWGFRITTILFLTAGVFLSLWLAKLINKHGIGNGIAILVLCGVISKLPAVVYQLVNLNSIHNLPTTLLLIFIPSIIVIWLMTSAKQSIPVSYKDSDVQSSIILRFNWAGKVPLGFAQSIVLFPIALAAFFPSLCGMGRQLSNFSWLYIISFFALTVFSTYLYIAILFKPREIIKGLKKYNCQLEGVGAKKELEKYLDNRMKKNVLISVVFLAAIGVLPSMYQSVFSLPYLIINFIAGTALLIVIGVFYDLKCQIESYFARKEDSKIDKWGITYTAFDETEAEIKKGFLKTKGISCVIEPLRFSWGMPIKTVVDEYRLYVSVEKIEEAREVLG
ncbi:MAG: hypothetical protein KAS87_06405, partial [Candidatus Omnitrophica bacterium]|nr:hypothetical protein [Candidatus Omnitrophota bacterium]